MINNLIFVSTKMQH